MSLKLRASALTIAWMLYAPHAMAHGSDADRTAPPADASKPSTTLAATNCRAESLGRVLGGLLGAAIGRQVAGDDRRTAGTVGGALAGVWLGGVIGRKMDQAQLGCQDKGAPDAATPSPSPSPSPSPTPMPMPGSGRTLAPVDIGG